MKVTDIMVDDWVLKDMNYEEENPMYTHPEYRPYKIQNGEDIDIACETNCIGDADIYMPIPLTPEILEKNFLKRHGAYVILDDYFEVEICEYNDGLYRLLYNCTEMSLPRTQITEIGFVHQLQHALKMVGVEQEITLT